jgi:hypothetical protein
MSKESTSVIRIFEMEMNIGFTSNETQNMGRRLDLIDQRRKGQVLLKWRFWSGGF